MPLIEATLPSCLSGVRHGEIHYERVKAQQMFLVSISLALLGTIGCHGTTTSECWVTKWSKAKQNPGHSTKMWGR